MKFWQKLFVSSLLVTVIMFTICAYILILNNFKTSIHHEISNGLYDHQVIRFSFESGIMSDLLQSEKLDIGALYRVSKLVATNNKNEKMFISIYDQKQIQIYSNIPFRDYLLWKPQHKDSSRQYTILDVGGLSYLLISGYITTENGNVYITIAKDISGVFLARDNQMKDFLKLNIITAIISAVILFFITRLVTRPVKDLMQASKQIANGDYSHRVSVKSTDEIGELGRSFNIMAEAVQEKMATLKKEACAREKFIDNLTHELKTPLTSIIGYADMLRSKELDKETVFESSNYIYEEGKRLEGVSQKLMDLLLLKRFNFTFLKCNAPDLLKDTAMVCMPLFANDNVKLVVNGDSCIIEVEKDLFKTMMINFVENARKASYPNSVVKMKGRKILAYYVFEVRDYGKGIPAEELDKICEPFYMVDKSRARQQRSVGLGLALCLEIANLHAMKLRIHSKINEGTVIRAILPIKKT